jgi:iron complex outermembrane receptor protein
MNKTILAASIAAALSFTQQVAFAEDDTLVVTATRVNELANLPASVTTITAEDIEKSPARTLPELLSEEVGVNTRSLFSHGSRASVGLRGFGETSTQNTLILLDGRRLNGIDLSSVNYAAIPFENIERIEIIRGTGGVLYGDGATGGVINIITKDPQQSENYSVLKTTVGSSSHKEVNAFTTFSNEKFSITANVNSQENDGYRDNNDFDQNSGQVDLRVPVSDGEVYVKLGAFQQNLEFPGVRSVDPTTSTDELSFDRKGTNTPNDWGDEYTQFVTLGYSTDLNEYDSLVVDAGYRRKRTRAEFFAFGGAYSESAIRTLSFTPRLTLARNIAGYPANSIIGADVYIHEYRSNRSSNSQNIGHPLNTVNVDQENVALYGQTTVELTEKTSVTAGVRVQNVRQKARDHFDTTSPSYPFFGNQAADFTESDTENSFELGIKHALSNNWNVYGRIGRSVRFGTVDELFELNDSFTQIFSRLKPQTSRDIEAGVNFHNDWLNSTLSVFQQDLTDEIHFNPTTFQNINLDDTEHRGIELSANAKLNDMFSVKAGYTYLNAEFTAGTFKGNDIPLVPEHTYNLSLLGELPFDVSAAVSWNYVSASLFANDISNTFGQKIPSYQTVDLKVSKKVSALEISLQVNNLLDEEYFNFGVNSAPTTFGPGTPGKFNAYPLPERNAYLSASYTFE